MIAFEAGLVLALSANPQINAALNGRVTDGPPRQSEGSPYAVYRLVSSSVGYTLRGRNGNANLRYQLDIWDTAPETTATLAEAIADYLDGFRGWLGGCFVRKFEAVVVAKDDEPEDDAADLMWHRRRLDLAAVVKVIRPPRPPGYQESP